MAGDLSAHRRHGPLETFGDLPNGQAGSDAPRDIFPFGQCQRTQAAATHRRSDPSVTRQQEMDDLLILAECSTNRI